MKEILSRLDLLAAKLGQTVEALWPHVIRHTAIEAFTEIAIWCVMVVFAVILLRVGVKEGENDKWEGVFGISLTISGAVLLLFIITFLAFEGSKTLAKAFEPTGYTVKQIMWRVR